MSQSRRFQTPATLGGISTKSDGSLSLRFSTQEMNDEDIQTILKYRNAFGWLLFQEQEHKAEDIELEAVRRDTGGKSPSQRLRNSLYVLYQQSTDQSITFEQYYAQQMEKVIENVKSRLT